jgi:hypothetical protein
MVQRYLEFIKKHQYYSESQKKLREKEKQKNIKRFKKNKKILKKRDDAKYNPVSFFQQRQTLDSGLLPQQFQVPKCFDFVIKSCIIALNNLFL